jgi:hypothetical protein
VPVDPATLVPTPSPDGSTYACFKRRWFGMQELLPFVRCVILRTHPVKAALYAHRGSRGWPLRLV